MPMSPFYTKFREQAFAEMTTVAIEGDESLPDGVYGFLEFFCNERGCDCRRVVLHVIRPDTGSKVWASIGFGWESPAYYRRWSSDPHFAEDMAGASLDPLNPQTRHSASLLRLFEEFVVRDASRIERLKRHYRMFKGSTSIALAPAQGDPATSAANEQSRTPGRGFTKLQGQYLAFIAAYTKVNGVPPAEADIERYFEVSPPTVHQMILTLARRGLIERTPGKARAIQVLVPYDKLPPLE